MLEEMKAKLHKVISRRNSLPLRICEKSFLYQTINRKSLLGCRAFHHFSPLRTVQPYILADIGEGITECQIISWSVKPGDRVQQFDPICEVQSDKASVEITSRFDGIVKALHYAQDEIAVVGRPLIDLDIDDDVAVEESSIEASSASEGAIGDQMEQMDASHLRESVNSTPASTNMTNQATSSPPRAQSAILTPAVRHMLKKANIKPTDVVGTGKDGRITKEDVHRHLSIGSTERGNEKGLSKTQATGFSGTQPPAMAEDQILSFTAVESKMFEVMTRSLAIPHFLYTLKVDVTPLSELRQSFNHGIASGSQQTKLTLLPFIMKAVSQAFLQNPKLNSHLDMTTDPSKPRMILKAAHNFGLAIDSPQGLVVPVVKNVQSHSILSLAHEIKRLSELAQSGRLTPDDFKGASFTISNIGSIGGGVVSPVIVSPMVGILAVGRTDHVPVFKSDKSGMETVVKQEQLVLSWSADHRVLDGATVARAAEQVKELLTNVHQWVLTLK